MKSDKWGQFSLEFLKKLAHPRSMTSGPDWMAIRDAAFHHRMQNPIPDGRIILNNPQGKIRHNYLTNAHLNDISHYFSVDDGHYRLDPGVRIRSLTINNVSLPAYAYGKYLEHSGVSYIAALLRRNPQIDCLDLTNTNLKDDDVVELLRALESNTHLQRLVLSGNELQKPLPQKVGQCTIVNQEVMRRVAHIVSHTNGTSFHRQPMSSLKQNHTQAEADKTPSVNVSHKL